MHASGDQIQEAAVAAVEVARYRRRRRRRSLVALLLLAGGAALALWFALRSKASTGLDESYHVVPADSGGWDLTGTDSSDVLSHHDTQAHGVERATEMAAERGGGEVVIHGVDGAPRDTKQVAAS
ncbi:MAG TPA: DUF2188 domain-containing protein [Acidimicrobiales bacterium]